MVPCAAVRGLARRLVRACRAGLPAGLARRLARARRAGPMPAARGQASALLNPSSKIPNFACC